MALFVLVVVLPRMMMVPLVMTTKQIQLGSAGNKISDEFEDVQSRNMLESYYKTARERVPIDYPTKQIGECPHSKPQSTDLPIPNIPICVAAKSSNMRLI